MLELNKDMNLEVQLRLIARGNDESLHSPDYTVRLYDKDLFDDDFLGESIPDENGLAKFVFTHADFNGPLGLDKHPDFYFVVYKDGKSIFQSRVMANLDLSDVAKFVNNEGNLIDLGTFLI